jgi:hypothetical protein
MMPEPEVDFRPAYHPLIKKTVWDCNQRSVDRYVGYRALWMKVIIRAAFDWVSHRDSPKMELKKEAERAQRWLFGKNELINSFDNICELLDLSPHRLRIWARSLTKAHVAKIEHLERESATPVALAEAQRKLIEGEPVED